MATMTHGVFVDGTLIRPFASEAAARAFAARTAGATVRPIRWVRDDRYTAGGRFVRSN
jgi:hypothetical protein